MPLLKCNNVALKYEGNIVCRNINFSVEEGEYVCVLGENGSGKTTLLKAILGLKNSSDGEIIFAEGFTRADIGYLPQNSDIKRDFPASVFEIVLSGFIGETGKTLRYKKIHKSKTEELLKMMDIYDLKNKCLRELSGGQQQRVLLARALACAKKLLVLDEPVARLDPVAGRRLYDLIRKINKEMGIAVIMVSHDVKNATLDADFIVHLCNNQMCLHSVYDFINSPEGKAYMGGHF